MSFEAYGFFVEVEPVQKDSGLVQLAEGAKDNRSVFRVISVGHKVEGIKVDDFVFATLSEEFIDKGTGVKFRVCHPNHIIAVCRDAEWKPEPQIIELVGVAGNA